MNQNRNDDKSSEFFLLSAVTREDEKKAENWRLTVLGRCS